MTEEEEEPGEPRHPLVEATESLGCCVIIIVLLLLLGAACHIGPWA